MDKLAPLRDIMTREIISLHEEDSLLHVNKTFEAFSFHHIPILDTKRRVVGMISKTDLLQLSSVQHAFSEEDYRRIKIKDFMTPNVFSLSPDDSVGLAADLFITNNFHAVTIVEDGELVGLVTTHDLIKYAFGKVLPIRE